MKAESKDTKKPIQRNTFVLYTAHWETISQLPDKDRLALFDAIFTYQLTGETPELTPMAKLAFGFLKIQMNIDREKYEAIVKRNRENGMKGGRPPRYQGDINNPETQNNPNNPDGYFGNPNEYEYEDKDEDGDEDKNEDKDRDRERSSFLNNFYDKEIKAITEAITSEEGKDYSDANSLEKTKRQYVAFLNFLKGDNKLGRKLNKCNDLEPLTMDQFKELKRIEMQTGESITEKCEFFEDSEYKAKHKTLYTHIKSWLKPAKKEGYKSKSNLAETGGLQL